MVEARTQAEDQARHTARDLQRELGPAAFQEQIDDRQIERLTPQGRKRRSPIAGQADSIALAPQQGRERPTAAGVLIYEQYTAAHGVVISKPRTRATRAPFAGLIGVGAPGQVLNVDAL